mgnify:CR=1 FL=1
MNDRPTSFHDFKWACGHVGPGYCKVCRDEQADALAAKDKRIASLEREVEILRAWGNKDCTAMADEALAKEQDDE